MYHKGLPLGDIWQVKWYKRLLEVKVGHYVAENQNNWDIYVQALTYNYKRRRSRPKYASIFSASLPKEPSSAATFDVLNGSPTDIN